jgi:arylsulfatase A-like enzyme
MINPHRKMNIVLGRDLRRACVFAIACSVGASAPHSRLNAQQPPPAAVAKASARPPNILFVVFDDLNDWTTPTKGHPQAQTPTLQSIAARGVNFTNAHVQAPLCNPSRASFLASLRPSTTGIYSLSPSVRTALTNYPDLKDHQLMPAYFASHGYHTVTMGKIFHTLEPQYRPEQFETWIGGRGTGGGAAGRGAAGQPGAQGGQPGEAGAGREGRGAAAADPPGGGRAAGRPRVARGDQGGTLVDWGPYPDRDEDTGDYRIADAAIEQLKGMPRDKPFFMAVGFSMPHVPIYAPAKWFDRLPLDKVQLPPIQHGDRKDTPAFSWYLHWALPEQRLSWLEKFDEEKGIVRAYLAGTTFVDAQFGRVLEALQANGFGDNTIIVAFGDHGYHLGEKEISGKNTLWERSTHVPLVIAGPGVPRRTVSDPAELLDLYPTLVELTGLPTKSGLEGQSLVSQMRGARRTAPAITTANQGNHAIRTNDWRYIRYADGSEELYDAHKDPNEWTNLAGQPKYRATIAELAKWLPKVDRPAVPGSNARALTRAADGTWMWEGHPINPADVPSRVLPDGNLWPAGTGPARGTGRGRGAGGQ